MATYASGLMTPRLHRFVIRMLGVCMLSVSMLGAGVPGAGMLGAGILGICVVGVTASTAQAQEHVFWKVDPYIGYDREMYVRPRLELGGRYLVHREGLVELWMRALERPDPSLQRMVIDTLAIAHQRGVPDLEPTQERLVELLKKPETRLDVRRSIAQTLVVMDAKSHADVLAELAIRDGRSVASILEPALARWESDALKDVWLKRIQEGTAGTEAISLAIEGLSVLETAEAADAVERIVASPGLPSRLRLVAAKHMGRFRSEGIADLAKRTLAQPERHPGLSALLAVELLSWDESEESIEVLSGLVDHEQTIVQSKTLGRLYEIDFRLVDQHAEKRVDSPDVNVRRWIALAMLDTKNPERAALLANLMDDIVKSLRNQVTEGLEQWGQDASLKETVLAEGMRILNEDAWRGCEQACVLLTKLDHKPSGTRMVELLKHPRGEVKVASAWGLTKLRMPEHLPDMLEHANEVYQGFKANELNSSMEEYVQQLAHLFIAFGDQNYQPAQELVAAYVPRDDSLGLESRTAAAWAIGMLNVDNPDTRILKMLTARIRDNGIPPERGATQQMAAISIGRMKGESEMPTLREFSKGIGSVARACLWSIEKLTGEPMPALEDTPYTQSEYFLTPLDPDE